MSEDFTDNEWNVAPMVIFVCDGVGEIVDQGENASIIFSFSHIVFKSCLSQNG